MRVRSFASCLTSPLGLVNFHLLTSSLLVFNCTSLPYHVSPVNSPKTWGVSSLPPAVSEGGVTSASSRSAHVYTIFGPLFFPSHFWLLRVFWPGSSETVCFIYLFIFSISVFYEPFNYVTLTATKNLSIISSIQNADKTPNLDDINTHVGRGHETWEARRKHGLGLYVIWTHHL